MKPRKDCHNDFLPLVFAILNNFSSSKPKIGLFNKQARFKSSLGNTPNLNKDNEYGNEVLYNGLTGEQLLVNIFIGPTFYQRLKHMVVDKYLIYSTDIKFDNLYEFN